MVETVDGVRADVVERLGRVLAGAHGKGPSWCDSTPFLLTIFRRWLQFDMEEMGTGLLPLLTCEACRGEVSLGLTVTAAWQSVRLAAKMIDDVEDDESSLPAPVAVNAGVAFLCAAQSILADLHNQSPGVGVCNNLSFHLARDVLRACMGQHSEISMETKGGDFVSPDEWLDIALAKSGALTAWAAGAGAAVAGANSETIESYREFGRRLGALLQIADDYNDIWRAARVSDLAAGKLNLGVSYSLSVLDGKDRDQFVALLVRARQGEAQAENECRLTLADIGAQHYMICTAAVQYELALEALSDATRSNTSAVALPAPLVSLLDNILPVLRETIILGAS